MGDVPSKALVLPPPPPFLSEQTARMSRATRVFQRPIGWSPGGLRGPVRGQIAGASRAGRSFCLLPVPLAFCFHNRLFGSLERAARFTAGSFRFRWQQRAVRAALQLSCFKLPKQVPPGLPVGPTWPGPGWTEVLEIMNSARASADLPNAYHLFCAQAEPELSRFHRRVPSDAALRRGRGAVAIAIRRSVLKKSGGSYARASPEIRAWRILLGRLQGLGRLVRLGIFDSWGAVHLRHGLLTWSAVGMYLGNRFDWGGDLWN